QLLERPQVSSTFDAISPDISSSNAFAEGGSVMSFQKALDIYIDELSDRDLIDSIHEVMSPIIRTVMASGTYDEIMENLKKIYPDLSVRNLTRAIKKAIYVADVVGRLSARRR
ncbi:protein containing DUF935, partial [Candidatus Magnetobacterium bavaricum]